MTKIKLCGLTRPEDIEMANRLQPDYIGFVFARKSRRYISPEAAAALKKQLDPSVRAVGVFVNEDPPLIAGLLRAGTIDLVQLHGSEGEEEILSLQREFGVPVLKAFSIHDREDILRAEQSPADYVLFDTGAGGTGQVFNWSLTAHAARPFFLAGGLSPENVQEAIRACRPWAVDVSSGIETGGVKDPEKAADFVRRVRTPVPDSENR